MKTIKRMLAGKKQSMPKIKTRVKQGYVQKSNRQNMKKLRGKF